MVISRNDLEELRRIATNTYDRDKAFMQRVLTGIAKMEKDNSILTNENTILKTENANLKAAAAKTK